MSSELPIHFVKSSISLNCKATPKDNTIDGTIRLATVVKKRTLEPQNFFLSTGLTSTPQEWLLYSGFSVVLAFVHLYTLFMIVPIFNSMMRIDKSIIEAAYDSGANGFQILWNIIIPLCKPGIVIGSIFVITVVMGDFITIGIMGGQQIPSIGKIIYVEMSYLQLPAAAANAVILLLLTLLIIWIMTKMIDIRKEL